MQIQNKDMNQSQSSSKTNDEAHHLVWVTSTNSTNHEAREEKKSPPIIIESLSFISNLDTEVSRGYYFRICTLIYVQIYNSGKKENGKNIWDVKFVSKIFFLVKIVAH